jgi:hypothetical protein
MFAELLQLSGGSGLLGPGRAQSEAHRNFALSVSGSKLQDRKPEELIPSDGIYVVIGVATYAPPELELLDEVDAAHCGWCSNARVAVFDVLNCQRVTDFDRYIPGIGDVAQTPVAAVWERGTRVDTAEGLHRTRELLRKHGILK